MSGSVDASYATHGKEIFESVDVLNVKVRNINHLCLEKKEVEAMMTAIIYIDNSKGEIFEMISDKAKGKLYLPMFPLFRTLSKMCNLSMNMRKTNAHIKSVARSNELIEKTNVEIQGKQTMITALNIHSEI